MSQTSAFAVVCVVEESLHEGPTGRFYEVAMLDVRDYGDNVLWSGTVFEYAQDRPRFNVPTHLVATMVVGKPSALLVGTYVADYYAEPVDSNA